MNPKKLIDKYKKREKKKSWRPKNPMDKLNCFLSNSIEQKPIFSKKIDDYLKKQILSLINKEGKDLGRLREYKNKLYLQTTKKFDDFYNTLTEKEREISHKLGEKILENFVEKKLEDLKNQRNWNNVE